MCRILKSEIVLILSLTQSKIFSQTYLQNNVIKVCSHVRDIAACNLIQRKTIKRRSNTWLFVEGKWKHPTFKRLAESVYCVELRVKLSKIIQVYSHLPEIAAASIQ